MLFWTEGYALADWNDYRRIVVDYGIRLQGRTIVDQSAAVDPGSG